MAVNNYRSADNVVCGEALVIEGKPGITFVSKKGKQVACMVRMRLAGWIVVVPCFPLYRILKLSLLYGALLQEESASMN